MPKSKKQDTDKSKEEEKATEETETKEAAEEKDSAEPTDKDDKKDAEKKDTEKKDEDDDKMDTKDKGEDEADDKKDDKKDDKEDDKEDAKEEKPDEGGKDEADKKDEAEKKEDEDEDDKQPAKKDAASKKPAKKKETKKPVKEEEDKPDEEMKESADEPAKKEDDEEEDKKEEASTPKGRKKKQKSPPKTDESRPSRSKRARKTSEVFEPENFHDVDRSVPLVNGRGAKLGELKVIKDAVTKSSADSLVAVHKLLYTMRGAPPRKNIKHNILAFHGFLSKKKEGEDPKEREDMDDEAESKMGAKAYKLTIPQLKKMCDFFGLDRHGVNDKDGLVDCLLDFLGEPSKEHLKGHKKKDAPAQAAKSSKKGKKSADEDEEKEEDDDYEVIERGTMPTDKQLRQWTRAYVRCFNMEKVTIKHALEVAGDKFGVDLASKKDRLKEILGEEM